MIYIRKNENVLEKYEVKYDEEELKKLRERVIKNCGEKHLVHEEVKESGIPRYESWIFDEKRGTSVIHYEDVKSRKSGNKGTEWDHYDEYEVDLFYCDYTMYICPYFLKVIDDIDEYITVLFDKDINSIPNFLTVEENIEQINDQLMKSQTGYVEEKKKKLDELNKKYRAFNKKKTSISDSYLELQELIDKIKEEINKIESNNEKEAKELTIKLEKYMKIRCINKNQESWVKYFYELLGLIEFKLVDTLDISEIERVNEFFNQDLIEAEKKLVLI